MVCTYSLGGGDKKCIQTLVEKLLRKAALGMLRRNQRKDDIKMDVRIGGGWIWLTPVSRGGLWH
jgi:hypothetical protein